MIGFRRLAMRHLASFIAWRHRRRVKKAAPEFAELERLLSERRKQHKPVKDIMQRRTELVHELLRQERKAA